MLKKSFSIIIAVLLTLGLSISFQSLLAAWVSPTADPPTQSIASPLTQGQPTQYKEGGLWLNLAGRSNPDPGEALYVTSDNQLPFNGSNIDALVHVVQNRVKNALRIDDALNDTTPFVVDESGNVGIGTNDPQNPLSLNGNGYIINGSLGFNRNPTDGTLPPGGNAAGGRYQLSYLADRFQIESYNSSAVNTGVISLGANNGNLAIGTSPVDTQKLRILQPAQDLFGMITYDGSSWIGLVPNLGAGSYNQLSKAGDVGIFFSDGALNTGNLVIAPHSNAANAGLYMTNTGNLGVGINNPRGRFSVGFNNSDALNFYSPGDNTLAIQTTLDDQVIGVYGGDNQNRLILQPTIGYVGIGTNIPAQKLDVNGNIRLNGRIYGAGSVSSYGALTVQGDKNGWGGINFRYADGSNAGTLMVTADHQGFYNNADNGWDWYFTNGTLVGGTIPWANISNKPSIPAAVSCNWNGWYYTAVDCSSWIYQGCADYSSDFRCVGGIITEARNICTHCLPVDLGGGVGTW